ncbi:ABC transporter permease [Streptomyces sp. NPDC094034]|uniref:ABC transporter permease n=1 Tax=Streptomyces sp. NPDC094034 TaxID=3155309 RepID=UPI0033281ECD
MSTAVAHLTALSRIELRLFARSKTNLFNVLVIPVLITMGTTTFMDQYDLAGAGLAMGQVMISTSAGIVLVMALYAPLTGVYVLRREDHLLKRLRTGEVHDTVILASPAVPMIVVAVVQFALIAAAITVIADLGAPAAPHLALLGILLGALLTTAVAALTTAVARTAESAQGVSTMGFLFLLLTSGTLVPMGVLPDIFGDVLGYFPLTPAVSLVQSGWTGEDAGLGSALIRVATIVAWTALATWGVRRWFRWEPRD